MSSTNYWRLLVDRHPEAVAVINRLADVFASSGKVVVHYDRLLDLVHPASQAQFAEVMRQLVRDKKLREVIRVESAKGGGIGDFSSLEDVPDTIHDWRTDQNVEVTADMLRVVYEYPHPRA